MFKELLGEAYKEGMTIEEIENALKDKKLVDISTGDYVAKGKYEEAVKKATTAEGKAKDIQKEYDNYKSSKMTDDEKAEELLKQNQAEYERVLAENKIFKQKEDLYSNGYTADEVKSLIDNDFSPETYAKIANARVEEAIKKSKTKGIKETTKSPAADDMTSSDGITKEQFDKMGYKERKELFNNDPETYNKLIEE